MPKANPALDLLATRPFERLAVTLRDRTEAVLLTWQEMVRDVLPGADRLTLDQLRNSLPEIIEQMARALESDRPPETLELVEMTKPHGAIRFHQNYNVREVVAEYRLFRRVVVEEVWRGVGGNMELAEVTALNMAIDTALEGGVLAFVDHLRGKIREACEVESKYLAFLSHDLRSHLNHATLVLKLHGERLKGVAGFEDTAADLEGVQRSICGTAAGMDRLLQAERLRRAAVEAKRERVDLRELIFHALGQFAHEAKAKGLLLRADVPGEATITSDAELIGLALQNLIGNAVKYSTKGVVRVTAEPQEQGRWRLSVSDQGPGIAAEGAQRLFHAFARGDTHGQPGVGLGLAIASQAARLLGGKLGVESTPAVGSTFWFVLPNSPPAAA